MPPAIRALYQQLTDWRIENDHVERSATEANLQRLRWLAPGAAAWSLLQWLVFSVLLWQHDGPVGAESWPLGRWLIHLAEWPLALLITVLARRWRHLSRRWIGRALCSAAFGATVVLASLQAGVDQSVGQGIASYLLACVGASLALYQRPLKSGLMLGLGYALFFHLVGNVDAGAGPLLPLRLQGLVGCVLAWTLSLLLWRQFSALAAQEERLARLTAELQHKQQELERLTRVDALTGVLNRATFAELTERELARARRQATMTTLLLLDLDHFKQVNDSWGHPCGDAVLKQVAALCSASLRSTDLVGRLGGEEFVVLLPGTSQEAGRRIAEKLRQRIEQNAVSFGQLRVRVTVSIGLASNPPQQNQNFEILYSEADKALYMAKEWGRNRVV